MARRYFQTPEFKALHREWTQKLKDSGFRELEVIGRDGRDTGLLNGMAVGDLQRGLYEPETERYFALCRAHVHRIERRLRAASSRPEVAAKLVTVLAVWSLHSEGLRPPAIRSHTGVPRNRVKAIVAREEELMRRAEDRADAAEEKDLVDD